MEIFQLRYFAAAARHLNFSRAADEVCVSQPSLSLQIANLEKELGAPLFTRHGRTVRLTEAGEALREYATQILEIEAEARLAVRAVVGLKRGRLSIWTLPTPGQHLLPPSLARFREAYPGVEISVREAAPSSAIRDAVRSGRADLGFLHPLDDSPDLARRTVLKEELALVVPEGHPFAGRDDLLLSEAAGEDFVWVQEGATPDHPLYAACLAAGFAPHIACVSGSAAGMQSLVAAGLGIALLPRLAIHPAPGAVVAELMPPRPTRTIVALWRADSQSHAATAFLEMVAPEG